MARAHTRQMLSRLWRLITALDNARFGRTVPELMEALETSHATVYRDIETLRQAGVAIETRTVNGQKRYWLGGHGVPAVAPSPLQLGALLLARDCLSTLEGTNALAQLDALMARWATLPKQPLPVTRRKVPKGPAAIVRTIDAALAHKRRIALEYQGENDGMPARREVDPIALRAEGEQLYLFAFDSDRADYRTFKLTRTSAAQLLDTRAGDHSAVDLERRFARSVRVWSGGPVTHVVIRVSPEKARWVGEYPLISDQETDPQRDGSVIVRAEVNGTAEALRWVLSWGGHAEAIAPPELRRAAQTEVTAAAARYAHPATARTGEQVVSPLVRRGNGRLGT